MDAHESGSRTDIRRIDTGRTSVAIPPEREILRATEASTAPNRHHTWETREGKEDDVSTSRERTSRSDCDTETHGRQSHSATVDAMRSTMPGGNEVTLRRQPDNHSPGMPTTGTVHYHLNIENCDGVNVYMNGTDMCQVPSRAVHVSRVGNAQRLSWMVDVESTLPKGGMWDTKEDTDKEYNTVDLFNTVVPEDTHPSEATDLCSNQCQHPRLPRSTNCPDDRARSYVSKQLNAYTAQHQILHRGDTQLVQASSELTALSVDDTPNVRQVSQVVMDGKCPLSDTCDGRNRLTSETNRFPQFETTYRTRGHTLDGMTHNRDTESTKHVVSSQHRRHPVDSSEHPLAWLPTASVASTKPVAVVKPKSRIAGTTRGTRGAGTSRGSAASPLTEINTMVINERIRSTASATVTGGSAALPSSGNGNVNYSHRSIPRSTTTMVFSFVNKLCICTYCSRCREF